MPIFNDIPYLSQEDNNIWNKTLPNDNINIINHLYEDSPNIFIQKYNESYFNCNWCFNITADKGFNINKLYESLNYFQNISKYATKFNTHWVNNIYYNDIHVDSRWSIVSIFQQTNDIDEYNMSSYNIPFIKLTHDKLKVYALLSPVSATGDTMLILYACGYDGNIEDRTNLTFLSILENLKHNQIPIDNPIGAILSELYKSMSSVKSPSIVKFNKSILVLPTQSPNIQSRENEYYKNDNVNTNLYVIRYSGSITPTFIDIKDTPNYIYVKDRVIESKFNTSKYFPYIRSGYVPVFPSLQYTSLVGGTLNYNLPFTYVSQDDKNIDIVNTNEYSWFNSGISLILHPELELSIVIHAGEDVWNNIKSGVLNYLKSIYNTEDDDKLNYIYNLYDITYNFEYKDTYNMPNIGEGVNSEYDYIYDITLTLK